MSTTFCSSKRPRIIESTPNVHQIHFDDVRAGWEQWILLSSDRHHDNAHADHSLEHRHLKQALERNALIIDMGDLFCAMGGKFDPRSNKSALRSEDKEEDYLDCLVENATKFYAPYAHLFAVIGKGNHETNIRKRCGTDLTNSLVRRLNGECAERGIRHTVHAGGYGGWVQFFFKIRKTVGTSKRLKYFHGSGGGGPVTRGVIQTNRQAVYLPDADFVVNGHTHDNYLLAIGRERITQAGKVEQDKVWFVRTPSYKDEYGTGAGDWHVERGAPPKPIGAAWLRLFCEGDSIESEITLALK